MSGLVIIAVLDIDNFEVNLHALAAAIIFTTLLFIFWKKLSIRWRKILILGFVLLITYQTLHQKELFAWLVPTRCLYITPNAEPLTGILQSCQQIHWWNPLLWPLYIVAVTGASWLVTYSWKIWSNRGTGWQRKVITTLVFAILPVMPFIKNNVNNQGELDVIPWKRDIYAAYWNILGRAPEAKDFEFYASTRSYLHMSRIRQVLYQSKERRLKIRLLYKKNIGHKPTKQEVRSYAKSYLTT